MISDLKRKFEEMHVDCGRIFDDEEELSPLGSREWFREKWTKLLEKAMVGPEDDEEELSPDEADEQSGNLTDETASEDEAPTEKG